MLSLCLCGWQNKEMLQPLEDSQADLMAASQEYAEQGLSFLLRIKRLEGFKVTASSLQGPAPKINQAVQAAK